MFSELGMRSARSFIPYKEFQCWIETEDLFIFMYGPLVTMLQKTDLIDGELTDFRRLILDNIKLHASSWTSPPAAGEQGGAHGKNRGEGFTPSLPLVRKAPAASQAL